MKDLVLKRQRRMRHLYMSQNTLEVTKCADIDDLPNVYHHLNFDAQGQLLLSWSVRSGSTFLKVIGEPDTQFELKKSNFNFPMAQRFQDGRWLIADARCEGSAQNARLFSPDFQLLRSFHLGDAIEHLRVNQQDQIWVGYFDENPLGLRCFNDAGRLTYDYNQSSGLEIFDLYALHIDARDNIWVYPYTDFYLARLANDRAKVVLETCPVAGARGILVSDTHVAFLMRYQSSAVYVHEIKTQKGKSVALTCQGEQLRDYTISTFGDKAAIVHERSVYTVTLTDLVMTLKH